jgi:hypothetical protein
MRHSLVQWLRAALEKYEVSAIRHILNTIVLNILSINHCPVGQYMRKVAETNQVDYGEVQTNASVDELLNFVRQTASSSKE